LNCDSDLKITSLIFKSPDLNPLEYHVSAILGRNIRQNPYIAELQTALLSIWNDLPHEFTDKASCHFERDFDSVWLQLADILNTQFKYRQSSWHSYWNVWSVEEKVLPCL